MDRVVGLMNVDVVIGWCVGVGRCLVPVAFLKHGKEPVVRVIS